MRLTAECGLPEIGGGSAIGLQERRAEMTVAAEAEFETQLTQIFVLPQQIQRTSQAKAQLIAVQRHPLHLLEYLGQVYGRNADLGCYAGQCPSPGEIAGQDQLGAISQALPSRIRARLMRRARTKAALRERQGKTFRLKSFGYVLAQAVTQ